MFLVVALVLPYRRGYKQLIQPAAAGLMSETSETISSSEQLEAERRRAKNPLCIPGE